jgi:hypothetical protein
MSGLLIPQLLFQGFSPNGGFLSNGLLYTYQAGTNIPAIVYQDPGLGSPWTNPVPLNSLGQALIYLTPGQAYKFNLTDSSGNQIPGYPIDQVNSNLSFPSIVGNLVPATGNLYTLGLPGFSWANLYLGPNSTPILDSAGNVGSTVQTAAEIAAGVLPTDFYYAPGDIRRYGALLDGVTDDSAAWQAAVNVVCGVAGSGAGGTIYAPAGTSVINTTVTWLRNVQQVNVSAYGCRIISTAALGYNFVWVMGTGQNQNGVNVYGITMDHSAVGNSKGLVDLANALNTHFYDCAFLGGTDNNFIIMQVRNSSVGNDNTGCFWTRVVNCIFYYATSSGYFGIVLRAAANATSIVGCVFTNCDTAAILMQQDAGQTTMPNGVIIEGNAFEGFTNYAVEVSITTTTTGIAGLRCFGNRFETGGTAVAFLGTISGASSTPARLYGNHIISSVGAYLLNSSGDTVQAEDIAITPAINPSVTASGDFTWTSTGGNLAGRFGATGKGFSVQNTSGVEQGALRYKSGGGAALVGSTVSGSLTASNNLRGSGSTAATTTSTVTFSTAELDTSYYLSITPTSGGGSISAIVKNTGSFVITWTGTVTNTYDWLLIR